MHSGNRQNVRHYQEGNSSRATLFRMPTVFSDFLYKRAVEMAEEAMAWVRNNPLPALTGKHFPSISHLKGNPIFGRLFYLSDGDTAWKELQRMFEMAENDPRGMCYSYIFTQPVLLITRPEELAQLKHLSYQLDRGKQLEESFAKIFGPRNLLIIPSNEEWRKKRTLLRRWIFSNEALENQISTIQHIIDDLIAKTKLDEAEISLEDVLTCLTLNVFTQTQFNESPLSQEKAKEISDGLGHAIETATDVRNIIYGKIASIFEYMGFGKLNPLDKAKADLHQILNKNLTSMSEENLRRVKVILQNEMTTPKKLKELRNDAAFLTFAGHETTTRLIHFTLLMLAKHPDILEKLREEIKEYTPEDGKWTMERLKKLTYLQRILAETLRLYPPLPALFRQVIEQESVVLGDIPYCDLKQRYLHEMAHRDRQKDVLIPKGAAIITSPYVTHRRKEIYGHDADQFNPDRPQLEGIDLLGGRGGNPTYFPFGYDNRRCPGQKLATEETMLALIKLAMTYDFRVTKENDRIETTLRGSLRPKPEERCEFISRAHRP